MIGGIDVHACAFTDEWLFLDRMSRAYEEVREVYTR